MDNKLCISTFTEPLRTNQKFEELIKPFCEIKQYPAKYTFLEAGVESAGIYYIKSGRTKHYFIADDGTEKILYTLSDGWMFGESPVMLDEPTSLINVAMETSEVWIIPSGTAKRLYKENDIFRTAVTKNLCLKIKILRNDIEMLVFHPVKERILQLFCSTANRFELIDGKWYPLYNKYTHYEVSTIIGSARVTTSKLINELCLEGHIRMVNHNIQVNKDTYDAVMN